MVFGACPDFGLVVSQIKGWELGALLPALAPQKKVGHPYFYSAPSFLGAGSELTIKKL